MICSRCDEVEDRVRTQTQTAWPSVETIQRDSGEEDVFLSPESFIGPDVIHLRLPPAAAD